MPEISNFVPLIITTVVASIPEEAFFVVYSLVLLKRPDLYEPTKKNIGKIAMIVLPAAVVANVAGEVLGLNRNYVPFVGMFTISLCMIIIYKMWDVKYCLKVILSITVCFIIGMMVQLLYLPFILYGTNISLEELNKPGRLLILVSLIDRIIQISIIGLSVLRRKSFIQINYIKIISQSMTMKAISIFLLIFNFFYIYAISRAIYMDKILITMKFHNQILMITAVFLVPLMNIMALLVSVYQTENKEAKKRFAAQEEYKVSIADIDFYLKREEYQKIRRELDYLKANTDNLYNISK